MHSDLICMLFLVSVFAFFRRCNPSPLGYISTSTLCHYGCKHVQHPRAVSLLQLLNFCLCLLFCSTLRALLALHFRSCLPLGVAASMLAADSAGHHPLCMFQSPFLRTYILILLAVCYESWFLRFCCLCCSFDATILCGSLYSTATMALPTALLQLFAARGLESASKHYILVFYFVNRYCYPNTSQL